MTPDRAGLLARIGRVFLAFGIKVQQRAHHHARR
jgi:UTP:GlnB (protein PII) uridylyltransferase